MEKTAVAILDFCRSTTSDKAYDSKDLYGSIEELRRPVADDGSRTCHPLHAETHETAVTAADNDNAVSLGHLSAYPQPAAGLSILQQVKRPAIRTIKGPEKWTEIDITVDSGACVTEMPGFFCEGD